MALNDNDLLLINDSQDGNEAKHIKLSTLQSNIIGNAGNDLQAVTDNGNTTTNLIETSGGVKVTGGVASQVGVGFSFSNGQLVASTKSNGSQTCGLKCIHQGDGSDSPIASSLQIGRGGANGSLRPDYRGIFIENIKTNIVGDTVYGIYSQIGTDSGTNYNFYSAGSAPNFFAGKVQIGDTLVCQSGKYNGGTANDPDTLGSAFITTKATTSTYGLGVYGDWNNDSSVRAIAFAKYQASGQSVAEKGSIVINENNCTFDSGPGGTFVSVSDYRVKENITPLSSAIETVKLLNPVSYTFTNNDTNTYQGFLAHELKELNTTYAVGEKDAEEAIGTLVDYDGTVLQTEVPEPSAEELEYTEEVETDGVATMVTRTRTWTPLGTRPVYQGVDQTKLIPLLTKALQEALARIEVLEADHATMMNNNNGGY